MKDISEYEIGEIATAYSNMKYKVLDYIFAVKNNKRQIVSSKCKNIDTGKELTISWHKNECFN